MTPTQFKEARHKLRLSVNQMAAMLGVQPTQVRRMQVKPGHSSHRPVSSTTEALVRAWLDGYRPPEWPDLD